MCRQNVRHAGQEQTIPPLSLRTYYMSRDTVAINDPTFHTSPAICGIVKLSAVDADGLYVKHFRKHRRCLDSQLQHGDYADGPTSPL
jgi:hypothetical protein